MSRETGEYRFWVCDHADSLTCPNLIAANVPAGSTRLYTDEWPSDRGSHRSHATVRHGMHEWARDADGDGIREGTLPHLRGSRGSTPDVSAGVPGYAQEYLHLDVATDEAMLNTKRVTPQLIRRMCVRDFLA